MRSFLAVVCVVCLTVLGQALPASAASGLNADRVNGTYTFVYSPGSLSVCEVQMLGNNRLAVSFDLTRALLASAHTGEGSGEATLRGNTAIYKDPKLPACLITLQFQPGNALHITQQGDAGECQFGASVSAEGDYHKTSGRISRGRVLPGTPADPSALAGAAASDKQQALAAPDSIAGKRSRIDALTAQRQALLTQIASKKAEFDKHARIGTDAEKKAGKSTSSSKPSAAELLRTAQTEYQSAATLGDELVQATTTLRATEDELAQLIAEAVQAASDAKAATSDIRAGMTKLSALASANSDDAKKSAVAADQAMVKARGALGATSVEQFAMQRDKARKADEQLAAELAEDRAALVTIDAALKSARTPHP